jgi:hypothetical protein
MSAKLTIPYSNGTATQFIAVSDPYTITNQSSATYVCEINPQEVPDAQVHAHGDCSTPVNSTGFAIPIANVSLACTNTPASTVALSFPVLETTVYGDCVFVVGNITELGDWDPYNAVRLNADNYTDTNQLWAGGNAVVPAGITFEYKYIQWSADGGLLWECGENRAYTAPYGTCGTATAGNDPDYFRCGNH